MFCKLVRLLDQSEENPEGDANIKMVLKAFLMDSIRCYLFYSFKIRLEKFYGAAVSLHQSFYARLSCFSQFDKQLMRISA